MPFSRSLKLLMVSTLISLSIGSACAEVPTDNGPANASPEELTALAARHEHAEGVPLDYAKAISLYCSASKMGYAKAQYALGWMYAHGRGIDRHDAIAAHFFDEAAKQGHPQAGEMVRHLPLDAASPRPACLLPENDNQAETMAPEPVYPKGRIFDLVQQLAPRYEIDPKLVLAIIMVESGFNAQAVSPKNAQGLMQLMPDTAQRFRVKNSFDPEENIKGGLAYLQWLLAFFEGNVSLAVAAYNAGERAVERHRGIPPYPETRNYVRKITALYKNPMHEFKKNLSPTIFIPSKQIISSR